ncbi:hypothetical protein [Mesorhizobium sp. L48C026A00]|uniref:hypothetical protein n=1 Tax=Mesorhizobium sp. L48C026A00 TaxID=1287182 RepID=UPI0003CFB824|nr:hypothetical protein [Mesorhizobium sp. L48C026A00]ESZ15214.1 hypothetical protein X737_22040 [Mesorhizobium sp. L48C026A00]
MGGHTNLYSLFLLRSLDWLKPGGGLVFVVPTSFVAGPYFSGLRQEILVRAEVLRINLHEQRENLFLGAVQDVCLLTMQRRRSHRVLGDQGHSYELGIIDSNGRRTPCGNGIAKPTVNHGCSASRSNLELRAQLSGRLRVQRVIIDHRARQNDGVAPSGAAA